MGEDVSGYEGGDTVMGDGVCGRGGGEAFGV